VRLYCHAYYYLAQRGSFHACWPYYAAAAAGVAAAALKLLLVLMVWCIGVVLPVNYTVSPATKSLTAGT
jgi:hypothetical protein